MLLLDPAIPSTCVCRRVCGSRPSVAANASRGVRSRPAHSTARPHHRQTAQTTGGTSRTRTARVPRPPRSRPSLPPPALLALGETAEAPGRVPPCGSERRRSSRPALPQGERARRCRRGGRDPVARRPLLAPPSSRWQILCSPTLRGRLRATSEPSPRALAAAGELRSDCDATARRVRAGRCGSSALAVALRPPPQCLKCRGVFGLRRALGEDHDSSHFKVLRWAPPVRAASTNTSRRFQTA